MKNDKGQEQHIDDTFYYWKLKFRKNTYNLIQT